MDHVQKSAYTGLFMEKTTCKADRHIKHVSTTGGQSVFTMLSNFNPKT
jgi:hypothetical protein